MFVISCLARITEEQLTDCVQWLKDNYFLVFLRSVEDHNIHGFGLFWEGEQQLRHPVTGSAVPTYHYDLIAIAKALDRNAMEQRRKGDKAYT